MKNERRFICENDYIRQNCIAHLMALPVPVEGETDEQRKARHARTWEVEVRPYVETLKDWQRGGLHFLINILAEETGYTPGEMKLIIKQRVWGVDEKVGPDGRTYTFIRSSEHDENGRPTNKLEYSPLITECYVLGADLGITLPALDRWRSRAA